MGRWFIVVPPDGAARWVGLQVMQAFQNAVGMNAVKSFDSKTYLHAYASLLKTNDETMVVDLLNQSMVVQCLDFKATHTLVLALSPITAFTLNLLRKYGIVTIHWFYEDFRAAGYWKDVIASYGYFLAVQKGPIVDECVKSGVRFALMPTAAGSPAAPPDAAGRTLDAVFIGVPSPYRIDVLERLASRGISLGIAGLGWENIRGALSGSVVQAGWIHADQSMRLLARAKIGINISVSDPQHDRVNTQVSPRVFDILRAGCVLLTEETPLVREILADCRFHAFMDAGDAGNKSAEILASIDGAQADIDKNREVVERGHLYSHRVKTIISLARGGAAGK